MDCFRTCPACNHCLFAIIAERWEGVEAWLAPNLRRRFSLRRLPRLSPYGLKLLPYGRRRPALEAVVIPIFSEDLAGRVLPFDSEAATLYAELAARRRQVGRPISQFDAQIAAIAASRGAALATRNVADFAGTGVQIDNPWDYVSPQ